MILQRKLWLIVLVLWWICFGAVDLARSEREPDVQFVVTPHYLVDEMLELAGTNNKDVVYDLGCGDGRFLISAAKRFGARGVGIDIDPDRIRESLENAKKAGVADRVKFYEQDLFTTDIRPATLVALYLLPELNLQLRPKFFKELKPGTRIVSHAFDMEDWKPDATGRLGGSTYYYWVLPADVRGKWRISSPVLGKDGDYTVEVVQKFQEIQVALLSEGSESSISDARLKGDKISFFISSGHGKTKKGMYFKGWVAGDTISGQVQVETDPFYSFLLEDGGASVTGSHPWKAVRK